MPLLFYKIEPSLKKEKDDRILGVHRRLDSGDPKRLLDGNFFSFIFFLFNYFFYRKSLSPKRASISPLRRRSLSPSPVRRVAPKGSPKKPIHDRLGLKSLKNEECEKKIEKKIDKKEEETVLDPVLEARRRKFESNEIMKKQGVIRLKAKEEPLKKEEQDKCEENRVENKSNKENTDEIDEDALLGGDDDILSDLKLDGLFSDEESDSDNEGRFKTDSKETVKIAVMPFTKLINGGR